MKKNLFITLLLLSIGFVGCNNKNSSLTSDSEAAYTNNQLSAAVREEPINKFDSEDKSIEISRKLIKNGSISFRTSDLERTKSAITETIEKSGGYIADENSSTENKKNTITISARVPSEHFDALLKKIESEASKIDFKNLQVEDITQDFIDIETRLKTKKELELRYLELLKDAKSVSDILEIEKQMNVLRSDIESTEGRLRYLARQVSYSTLNITFYDHNRNFGFANKFENGVKSGWTNLLWVIVALANLWAIILFLIIIWVAAVVISKRRKIRNNK